MPGANPTGRLRIHARVMAYPSMLIMLARRIRVLPNLTHLHMT